MAWVKPQYPKGRVDWAGQVLASSSDSFLWSADVLLAQEIVDNWRAVHSYPLQAMKMTLKLRAKKIDANATVAQRLKRLASIKLKLRLSVEAGHHPQLSQMQDIGGCRAVMENVAQVRELEKVFTEASKKAPYRGPQHSKTFDYIATPKLNGYRSVHLVYKYRTDSPDVAPRDFHSQWAQRTPQELTSIPRPEPRGATPNSNRRCACCSSRPSIVLAT